MGGDGYARIRALVSARLSAQDGSSANVVKSAVPRCWSLSALDNVVRFELSRGMNKAVVSTGLENRSQKSLVTGRVGIVPRRLAVLKAEGRQKEVKV